MGFIYSSLNRGAGESAAQFDNRILRMLPFVTGKAYFDLRNYDAQIGEFGAYIEWDDELVDVLGYQLPAGGYFVKATTHQAYRFHRLDSGLPIYTKLISQNGRLYPYRTYVMMDGRPFSVEFGGGVLIPFEDRYEELGCDAAGQAADAGSQSGFRYLAGSQYRMFGSQYRTTGSQRMLIGSQRFRWNSSQMRLLFGSQGGFRYLTGSQYRMFGSQYRTTGSQRIMMGSQRMLMGSQQFRWNGSQELMVEFPQEWQLINRGRRPVSRIGGNAKFGYGLDLI